MNKPSAILCTALLAVAQTAMAERQSYSYLGLEAAYYDYQEQLSSLALETDYSVLNPALQSGAYVNANERWGFYLTNSSNFIANGDNESFAIDGVEVQTNQATIRTTNTKFDLTYQLSENQALLLGVNVLTFDFNRSDFVITEQGLALGIQNPNGDQGREDFDIADAITENHLSISTTLGYEVGNLFESNNRSRFSYQLQAMVGIPWYYRVTNSATSADKTLTSQFEGWEIYSRLSAGFKVTENIQLAATLTANYYQRDAIRSGNVTIPEVAIMEIKPGLAVFWSF